MMLTTTNIHHVRAISVERTDFGSFISHKFTFRLEDDSTVEVSAFAVEAITVEELPTHMSIDRVEL